MEKTHGPVLPLRTGFAALLIGIKAPAMACHPRLVALVLGLLGLPFAAQAETGLAGHQAASSWDQALAPTAAAPQAIGGYARGCQSGYQVLRPQRLRYFGQPTLIAFLQALGRKMAPLGHGDLLIGDVSQPRGGPMSFGHSSHQSGLDADIWLRFAPGPLSADQLRRPTPVSMVRAGAQTVDPAHWTQAQEDLIRLAAQSPGVARIFVNPAIKASLCARYGDQADWLGVLRPWRGHDEHIHIRLTCPPGNPLCENQTPPPPGSGCDAVQAWFQPPPPPDPNAKPVPRAPKPPMPAACQAVLAGQDGHLSPASFRP
jgi:penicillin-insensitive murein endopeptidase